MQYLSDCKGRGHHFNYGYVYRPDLESNRNSAVDLLVVKRDFGGLVAVDHALVVSGLDYELAELEADTATDEGIKTAVGLVLVEVK